MNVLFEEQNNSVVKQAAEAVVPQAAYTGMTIHHESFLIKTVEEIISHVGGSTHGHPIGIEKEDKHDA